MSEVAQGGKYVVASDLANSTIGDKFACAYNQDAFDFMNNDKFKQSF
jgi:hypothetical protein